MEGSRVKTRLHRDQEQHKMAYPGCHNVGLVWRKLVTGTRSRPDREAPAVERQPMRAK
jgi:hypothetical protein